MTSWVSTLRVTSLRLVRSLWYLYGPQGETRQLTNSAGTVTDTYSYTAYGSTVSASGSDANPFQYGGKFGYYTENNGVVLCGHRWYDTLALRWLSRDPIGYNGGDNLYAYCNDDPLKWNDAHGTQAGALAPVLQQGAGPIITEAQAAAAAAAAAAALGFEWLREHPVDWSGFNPGLMYPAPVPRFPAPPTAAKGDPPPNLSPGTTKNGAYRGAKRASGVPVCTHPSRVGPNVDDAGTTRPGEQIEFDQPNGRPPVIIRHEPGHDYPDDPTQDRGPHYNDSNGGHHDHP